MGLSKDQNNRRDFWRLAVFVAILAAFLEAGGNGVRDVLAWERDALVAGQLWRLVSGHFVHLGWSHLVLNLAGLTLVAWLVGRRFSWPQWFLIGGFSIAAIDIGFWLIYTDLYGYVGMSGMLYGLLMAGLLAGITVRDKESIILGSLIAVKIIWEQLVGPMPGSEATSGGKVVVEAHLYGAVGGLLGALVCLYNSPQPAVGPDETKEDT